MARLPRLVLPGIPYHVTQRGNRRAQVLFNSGAYTLYRDLPAQDSNDEPEWRALRMSEPSGRPLGSTHGWEP